MKSSEAGISHMTATRREAKSAFHFSAFRAKAVLQMQRGAVLVVTQHRSKHVGTAFSADLVKAGMPSCKAELWVV